MSLHKCNPSESHSDPPHSRSIGLGNVTRDLSKVYHQVTQLLCIHHTQSTLSASMGFLKVIKLDHWHLKELSKFIWQVKVTSTISSIKFCLYNTDNIISLPPIYRLDFETRHAKTRKNPILNNNKDHTEEMSQGRVWLIAESETQWSLRVQKWGGHRC